jgi:hypothetical protein
MRWESVAVAVVLILLAAYLGVQLVFRVNVAQAAEALTLAWRDVPTESSLYDLILTRQNNPDGGSLVATDASDPPDPLPRPSFGSRAWRTEAMRAQTHAPRWSLGDPQGQVLLGA